MAVAPMQPIEEVQSNLIACSLASRTSASTCASTASTSSWPKAAAAPPSDAPCADGIWAGKGEACTPGRGLQRQGTGLRRQGSGLRRQGSSLQRQESGLRRQGSSLRRLSTGVDDVASAEQEFRRAMSLVGPFLRRHGFSDVSQTRRGLFRTRCPLHVAVRENDAAMVRQLLLARADPKCLDGAGRTPLMLAQEKDHIGSHTAVLMALMPLPKAAGLSRGMSFKRSPSALF